MECDSCNDELDLVWCKVNGSRWCVKCFKSKMGRSAEMQDASFNLHKIGGAPSDEYLWRLLYNEKGEKEL